MKYKHRNSVEEWRGIDMGGLHRYSDHQGHPTHKTSNVYAKYHKCHLSFLC